MRAVGFQERLFSGYLKKFSGKIFMAVVFKGIPKVGHKAEIQVADADSRRKIACYFVYGGNTPDFPLDDLHLRMKSEQPFYVPKAYDNFLLAEAEYSDGFREKSLFPVKVIREQDIYYTESRISVVGNGLSLSEPFIENSQESNIVSDVDRINQSIFIILSTSPSEIPMMTYLGSTISNHLFKAANSGTLKSLQEDIKRAIIQQEPRVTVTDVTSVYDGLYTINTTVSYTINNTNIKSTFLYETAVS